MISVIAFAVMLAAGSGDARHDFVVCLKDASSQAKTQKIASDAFEAFARTNCAAVSEPFKSQLVAADVQHGMSRKDSVSDADSQISDYYSEWLDNYSASLEPLAPLKKDASAPQDPQ